LSTATALAAEWALKFLAVVILFACLAGWIAFAAAVDQLVDLNAAQTWPSRRGILTHSYATRHRGMGRRPYWDVEIAGVYPDSGRKFSARVGYGFEHGVWTRGRAERVAARYPVGTALEVYHAPDNPSHAILVRNNSPRPTWTALWVGLGLGVLPLALYGYGRWRRARASEPGADSSSSPD
jgi:hypothetical protein